MKRQILQASALAIGSLVLANSAYAAGGGRMMYNDRDMQTMRQDRYEQMQDPDMSCMNNNGLTPAHKAVRERTKGEVRREQKMHEYTHENNMRYNQ